MDLWVVFEINVTSGPSDQHTSHTMHVNVRHAVVDQKGSEVVSASSSMLGMSVIVG
jgi:hypothetical protein